MFQSFLTQLKERKIIQFLTLYAGGYWVALQVIDFFIQRFDLNPDWVKAFSIAGLCVIPSLLIFAWMRFSKGWWYKQLPLYCLNCVLIFLFIPTLEESRNISGNDEQIEKSVAVLPFDNLSGDPSQEYFSDGISEEILNSLVQIKNLKVPGRTSSFKFKSIEADVQDIGARLGVATVLDGSVRRQGNRVRVTAVLINVRDGYQIWSQQFDREVDDVFALQEEIARSVTQKLKVTLLSNETFETPEGLTKSKEAYDAYLKGRYFWNVRDLTQSEKYYLEAISFDSAYAAAYAGLAETYVLAPLSNTSFREAMRRTEEAASKAIALDSTMAMPYLAMAFQKCNFEWDYDEAGRLFIKALSLNSRYAPAHYWYGQFLAIQKRDFVNAIDEMKTGIELEPLGSAPHLFLGIALTFAGRYEEALKSLQLSIELNPANDFAYLFIGHCYWGLKQIDQATRAYQKASSLGNIPSRAILVKCYTTQKRLTEAKNQFAQLVDASRKQYVSSFFLAMAASFQGERNLAHRYLIDAFDSHENWVIVLGNRESPWPISDLLADPRNMALAEKYLITPNAK